MTLRTYHQKRSFTRTPEPRGRVGSSKGRSFVIQKHAASHLHYDFRLELNGVLLSWACPKGPSLDPAEKRLAVQVEDHPVDYGTFEGTIPEGEYGGGTVMLWDRGTWQCTDPEPTEAYEKGRLSFTLDGEKLHGGWHLVRMHGRTSGGKPNWLLMKSKDKFARPGDADGVVERHAKSVKTGRTMEEITAGRSRRVGRAAQQAATLQRGSRETHAVTQGARNGPKQNAKGSVDKTARRTSSSKHTTRSADAATGSKRKTRKHPSKTKSKRK